MFVLVEQPDQVPHQQLDGVVALGRLGVAVAAQVVAQDAEVLARAPPPARPTW